MINIYCPAFHIYIYRELKRGCFSVARCLCQGVLGHLTRSATVTRMAAVHVAHVTGTDSASSTSLSRKTSVRADTSREAFNSEAICHGHIRKAICHCICFFYSFGLRLVFSVA
jgi:hypothetical protein